MSMLTDIELASAAAEQDRRAQKALYERYADRMYAVCLGYARNEQDAKDLLQEGFIKVFRNISQYTGEGALDSWVRRIIVNTAIDKYRRSARMIFLDIGMLGVPEESEEPELPGNLLTDEFLELLNVLPEGCRLVFNLYVIEGYKHREIADQLGITVGTSKSHVSHAKRILLKKIESVYGSAYYEYVKRVFQVV